MASRIAKRSTCRMFDTPVIERFSRIHPAVAFAFWIPVLIALTALSLYGGLSVPVFAGMFVAGWFAWSLTEYLLHRYVFHFNGAKSWKRRFFFIAHGVHHDYPQDAMRLVMPLGVSIPLGLMFFSLMDLMLPRAFALALFTGYGFGYLFYDGIHYFTHHLKARGSVSKFLKRYHMVHHFAHVDGMYGVSMPLWDYVFGTTEAKRRVSEARTQPATASTTQAAPETSAAA